MNRPDGRAFGELAASVGLSGYAVAAYRVLDDYADRYRRSQPGVRVIARLSGFGMTRVRDGLAELVAAGFVEAWSQDGQPTVYWLPKLSTTPPQAGGVVGGDPTTEPHQPHHGTPPTPPRGGGKLSCFEFERGASGPLTHPQGAAAPPKGAAAPPINPELNLRGSNAARELLHRNRKPR